MEEKYVNNFKKAVSQVYDKKKTVTENLMNGVIKEQQNMYKGCLDAALKMACTFHPDYASLINQILGTTYTDKEFLEIAKPHIEAARADIEKYIIETRDSKRKFNKAQEMRSELDLAKENIDKIMHREQKIKPTFWQRVKNFFTPKKCKSQCK